MCLLAVVASPGRGRGDLPLVGLKMWLEAGKLKFYGQLNLASYKTNIRWRVAIYGGGGDSGSKSRSPFGSRGHSLVEGGRREGWGDGDGGWRSWREGGGRGEGREEEEEGVAKK